MDYYWGGDDPTGWLTLINNNLGIRSGEPLMYSEYRSSSALDYSMPDLFVRYLVSQKSKSYDPASMIKSFYNNKMTEASSPDAYINSVLKDAGFGHLTFGDALANFYVAAVAQENTGAYGFYDDPIVRNIVNNYPIYIGTSGQSVDLAGSGAIVLKTNDGKFTVPSNAGSDIKFIAFNKTTDPQKPTGKGTADSPYEVKTAKDLIYLNVESNASFKLMSDIDMATTGMFFSPTDFTGFFDGNGKTIHNLSKPLVTTNKGIIKNLTVNHFSGEFRTWTGVISDFNEGTITDCRATGNINVKFTSSKQFSLPVFGTMTAQNEMSGIVKNCYSDAK
ncbi:MAG: hypothetical protein RR614_14260, partial [Eubacterium sp.]